MRSTRPPFSSRSAQSASCRLPNLSQVFFTYFPRYIHRHPLVARAHGLHLLGTAICSRLLYKYAYTTPYMLQPFRNYLVSWYS